MFIDADIGFVAQDVLALSSMAQIDVIAGAYPHKQIAWHQFTVAVAAGITDAASLSVLTSPRVFNPFDHAAGKVRWANRWKWRKLPRALRSFSAVRLSASNCITPNCAIDRMIRRFQKASGIARCISGSASTRRPAATCPKTTRSVSGCAAPGAAGGSADFSVLTRPGSEVAAAVLLSGRDTIGQVGSRADS